MYPMYCIFLKLKFDTFLCLKTGYLCGWWEQNSFYCSLLHTHWTGSLHERAVDVCSCSYILPLPSIPSGISRKVLRNRSCSRSPPRVSFSQLFASSLSGRSWSSRFNWISLNHFQVCLFCYNWQKSHIFSNPCSYPELFY